MLNFSMYPKSKTLWLNHIVEQYRLLTTEPSLYLLNNPFRDTCSEILLNKSHFLKVPTPLVVGTHICKLQHCTKVKTHTLVNTFSMSQLSETLTKCQR